MSGTEGGRMRVVGKSQIRKTVSATDEASSARMIAST